MSKTLKAEIGAAAPDIEAGRTVLMAESAALSALASSLDQSFIDALDLLSAVTGDGDKAPGRVIVSGMGKSGHIGRKIAATLASTGTPAQFVHLGEASHGDLGMITERDSVVAISNSGETRELADLIQYTKRFRIPLIAITSKAGSTVTKAATVALILPEHAEAGAMGLAPTTSTTLTLALGDALAVALLERKGFTATDFHVLHPGGKLGQQLLKVGDLMHTGDELPLVGSDALMQSVLLTMTSEHFGCAGVVDADGRLCGVVTDGDLRRHMAADLMQQPVSAVMTEHPVVVPADTVAAEVLRAMNERERPITAIFVVDNAGHPIGIVHVHDFLRAGVA